MFYRSFHPLLPICSRAPTIVIAFLMKNHNYSYPNALEYIKSKRPIVSPVCLHVALEHRQRFIYPRVINSEQLRSPSNPHDTEICVH